jgi:transcription antitermination protein NusB
MALRKQPRSIARELALLSISQVKTKQGKLVESDLDSLVLAAIRTLTIEVQDNLEAASGEIKRGEERLLNSATRASDLDSAKVMIQEALAVSQSAINRVGLAVEFPEFLQLTNKEQVRQYAIELMVTINDYRQEIEAAIEEVLVGWQLSRLPRIDRDILRISVAEMLYLQVPEKVAINESVELAKRYSDEDGFRFLNGVLRRLSDRRKGIIPDPSEILEIPEFTDKIEIAPTKETKVGDEIPPKSTFKANQVLTPDQPPKNLPIIQQTAPNPEQI